MDFADAREHAPWASTSRTNEDFFEIAIATEKLNPLSTIPGWHSHSLFEDVLHDDNVGLRLDANGSALVELSEEGYFGSVPSTGSWQHKLNIPLGQAHQRFRTWCKHKKIGVSQWKFSTNNLTMRTRKCFPVLKAKARNSVYVSEWLTACTSESVDTEYKQQRHQMLKGFMEHWNTIRDARPRVLLEPAELERVGRSRESMLLCYHYLAKVNQRSDIRRYNVRPKYHRIDHCVRRCLRTTVNPCLYWTYGSEDFMGTLARLSRQVHGSHTTRGTVDRWLLFWWSRIIIELAGGVE